MVAVAAALAASAVAFEIEDFDLDAYYDSLPPAGTQESSGRGFSTIFIETSSAQTACESSADSAFYDDFRNAYIEAGACPPAPPESTSLQNRYRPTMCRAFMCVMCR